MTKRNLLFWLLLFLFYSFVTFLLFHHRFEHISTEYGMPDIDTDGGLWYQWYSIYTKSHNSLYYVTPLISFPFGFDLTFLPFSNLIYSTQIFILENFLGYSWQNLILITNISSIITYPLAAISSSLLCYYLTRNKPASIITGLVFSFSYYHVYMGRGQMSINHIEFIPLYFLSLFYYLNKRNLFAAVLSALVFSVLFKIDAYYAFFSGILSVVIFFSYSKYTLKTLLKAFLLYYPVLFVVLILGNLNFFISNFYLFNSASAAATGRNSIPKNELLNILFYFTPEANSFSKNYLYFFGYFISILIPFIAFSGLLFLKRNRLYLTLLLCVLVAIVISAYIPDLYFLNILYFKFFGIFRGVARMVMLGFLFIGIMIGIVISEVAKVKISKSYLRYAPVFYGIFSILIIINAITVDVTMYRKSVFAKDAELYDAIRTNKNIKVIATYPMTQGNAITGCPEAYQLKAQIIHNKAYACGASPFDAYSQKHYKTLSNINSKSLIDYLTDKNIDTIIISNRLLKNADEVNIRLKRDNRIVFVGRYQQSFDKGYISTTDLARDISVYQIKSVVENNKSTKDLFTIDDKNVKLDYMKISPTRYTVNINNLKKKSLLVFHSPYSNKWHLYFNDLSYSNDISFILNRDKNKPSIRIHDFENGWYIDPLEIKSNGKNYKENPDGSINSTVTLFFEPQKIFSLGDVTSTLIFAASLIYISGVLLHGKYKR